MGGSFQSDYRYYTESERADNRFDVRRGRLIFQGRLTRHFSFGMEYEFQGNETKNLVDAYGEAKLYGPHALRFGQFKEPFSLEWQSRDKALYFAERSIGYSLTPKRDIGLMLHGSFFGESIHYATGLFNGDGVDGSAAGNEHDDPEIACRFVVYPFKHTGLKLLNQLQFGGAATYANIDLANVDIEIKGTGMAGTNKNIYTLGHDTKFGVLQDVKNRIRVAAEGAWAIGPVAFIGEYIQFKYNDLEPAGEPAQDTNLGSWYISALYFLTGEKVLLSEGKIKPVYPNRFFNPEEKTWGAICLAARYEQFTGDKDWILEEALISVHKADAVSLALSWVLYPMHRIILDYTYTDFSDPIRSRVLPDGTVQYIDKENVVTIRWSMDF